MPSPKAPVPVAQARDIRLARTALQRAQLALDEAVYEAFVHGGSRREVALTAGVAVNTAQAMYARHLARVRLDQG